MPPPGRRAWARQASGGACQERLSEGADGREWEDAARRREARQEASTVRARAPADGPKQFRTCPAADALLQVVARPQVARPEEFREGEAHQAEAPESEWMEAERRAEG